MLRIHQLENYIKVELDASLLPLPTRYVKVRHDNIYYGVFDVTKPFFISKRVNKTLELLPLDRDGAELLEQPLEYVV